MGLWTLPLCLLLPPRGLSLFLKHTASLPPHGTHTAHPPFALNSAFLFIQAGQCGLSQVTSLGRICKMEMGKEGLQHRRGLWASPAPVSS